MQKPVTWVTPTDHARASAFSGNRLERRSEKRSETCVAEAMADPRARLIVAAGGKLLFRQAGETLDAVFEVGELASVEAGDGTIVLLGYEDDGAPWLAAQSALDIEALPAGYAAIDFRSVYIQGLLDDALLGIVAQGGALLAWHRTHAFCSHCGNESAIADGGYKRICPSCGGEHFPRTDPVVIMLTVSGDGERVLLGRSPHFLEGVYSCLAGFVEPGETLESAVRRETQEESGVTVGEVSYYSSQPWPFPYSLMIGMIGVAATETITIDDELEDARWFSRDDVRKMMDGSHPDGLRMPPKGAIAHRLIGDWAS